MLSSDVKARSKHKNEKGSLLGQQLCKHMELIAAGTQATGLLKDAVLSCLT